MRQRQSGEISIKRSLIQKPFFPATHRSAADLPPAMEDIVQCGAFKARRAWPAILGAREPRPGINFSHRPQKRLVNPLVNHSGLQSAKLMRGRHGQGHRQIRSMENNAASRPAADRRKPPRARADIRIPLRVAERDSGSRPSVETGDRASHPVKQSLVHSHLLGGCPLLVVLPKLQSGYHRFMAYQQWRRNPLLLLVAGGIEWLG